jgi:6-phosphogluconolactonase
MPQIEVYADPQSLAEAAVRRFLTLAPRSIAERSRFCVALSGGSTPKTAYALLGETSNADRFNWSKVHFFYCDERCVPPNGSESNYHMTYRTLLGSVSIPAENIHRIRGELGPSQAAEVYEMDLRAFFRGMGTPRFDLILLGLGEDGHTASLFPGSTALREMKRWAVSVEHSTPPPPLVPRVTLTPSVFNAAADVVFMVSGAGKADILKQVLYGDYQPEILPAQIVSPVDGSLLWLVDKAAAGKIGPINSPICAFPI